jgi:PAS domain S-box-containing protein
MSFNLQEGTQNNSINGEADFFIRILGKTTDAVLFTDRFGYVTYANDNFLIAWKRPKKALLGKHVSEITLSHESPDFFELFSLGIFTGEPRSEEIEFALSDEKNFVAQATITPVFDNSGKVSFFMGVISPKEFSFTDAAGGSPFKNIIDLVPHLIFIRDHKNRYLLVNKSVCDFFQLEANQILGKTDHQLQFDKSAAKKSLEDDLFVIENGLSLVKNNFSVNLENGQERVFHFIRIPYSDEQSSRIRVLGIMADVTRQKQVHHQLVDTRKKIYKASREKAKFLSIMSHEIRNSLNAITGITELLRESQSLDEYRENVEVLSFSSQSLLSLINEVLDFSRIESGRMEFSSQMFELGKLLDNIIQSFRPRADKKGLDLMLDVERTVPDYVSGDAVRLGQILNNLLGNALKFTSNGWIKLRVKLLEQTTEHFRISFYVSDTGIGIDAELKQKIFEPFSQASARTNRRYGGTGLGLSIAKQLVVAQRGEINVESTPGEGSEFCFYLDFKKPGQTDKKQETSKVDLQHDLSGARVLMVEDNVMSIFLARKVFSKWNIDLFIAETGSVAVEKISRMKFDIILLDLQMPDIDGFAVMEKIKQDPSGKNFNTPVIAFTASTETEIHEKAIASGMEDVIVKPYQPAQLLELMHHFISREQEKEALLRCENQILVDLSEQNPSKVEEYINYFREFRKILTNPGGLKNPDQQNYVSQKVIPALQAAGFESQANCSEDLVRLINYFEDENKNLIIGSIQKGLLNQINDIIEFAEKVKA